MTQSQNEMDANPPPAVSDSHSAFDLLHRSMQLQLRRLRWDYLRPLQVEAIHTVLGSDNHVVISAATASGKTEAAFLPVLSHIADEPMGSVRALYLGPLKALINDQFGRMEELCHYLEMPVHRWHGDVPASQKRKLIQKPGGVLLLTPESLESLFVNRSEHIRPLFSGLQFVVIDELHAFLGNERGLHLQSLLSRIRQATAQTEPFRVIGLSATLGDAAPAQSLVCPENPAQVAVIEDDSTKELRLQIHGYRESAGDDAEGFVELQIARDILRHCSGYTNLIFANRRSDVEVFADRCNELARKEHRTDRFLVHHGSLARDIREDTEADLKSTRTVTAFCSSTLELGIDIGSVHLVGQIDAPWSVASLKQRVGRSGRKDTDARLLRIYISAQYTDAKSELFDRLHLPLIQSIAVVQLMLTGWVETPRPATCDLSTLTHQIISVIAQTGGIAADALYDRLCRRGAFDEVEPAVFMRLLRRLGEEKIDVIEQTPEGMLILGLRGERLRASRDYYPVFATPSDYAVLHEGRALGTLPVLIPSEVEEHLLFAGRRWRVTAIDSEKREIHVVAAKGKKRPRFAGTGGEVGCEVRAMMQRVLQTDEEYVFLDTQAAALLKEARLAAQLSDVCSKSLVSLSDKRTVLMTWCGTRVATTLTAMLRQAGVDVVPGRESERIGLICAAPADYVRIIVSELANQLYDPLELSAEVPDKARRKYDFLLDQGLLELGVSRDGLEIEQARSILQRLCSSMS